MTAASLSRAIYDDWNSICSEHIATAATTQVEMLARYAAPTLRLVR